MNLDSRKWNLAERLGQEGHQPKEQSPHKPIDPGAPPTGGSGAAPCMERGRQEKKYDERKTRIEDLDDTQLQEFIEQLNESIRGIENQLGAADRRDKSGERPIDTDWKFRAETARTSKVRLRDKCIHRQKGHPEPTESQPQREQQPRRKSFERTFFEVAQEVLTHKQFEEVRAKANSQMEDPKTPPPPTNPYADGLDR